MWFAIYIYTTKLFHSTHINVNLINTCSHCINGKKRESQWFILKKKCERISTFPKRIINVCSRTTLDITEYCQQQAYLWNGSRVYSQFPVVLEEPSAFPQVVVILGYTTPYPGSSGILKSIFTLSLFTCLIASDRSLKKKGFSELMTLLDIFSAYHGISVR